MSAEALAMRHAPGPAGNGQLLGPRPKAGQLLDLVRKAVAA